MRPSVTPSLRSLHLSALKNALYNCLRFARPAASPAHSSPALRVHLPTPLAHLLSLPLLASFAALVSGRRWAQSRLCAAYSSPFPFTASRLLSHSLIQTRGLSAALPSPSLSAPLARAHHRAHFRSMRSQRSRHSLHKGAQRYPPGGLSLAAHRYPAAPSFSITAPHPVTWPMIRARVLSVPRLSPLFTPFTIWLAHYARR